MPTPPLRPTASHVAEIKRLLGRLELDESLNGPGTAATASTSSSNQPIELDLE